MKKGTIVAFNGVGMPLSVEEHEIRPIASEEILVRNVYTTICGSDIHTYSGVRKEKCPTVLGHEIVGEILEIGAQHSSKDNAGNPLLVGDMITWSIFSSDPHSDYAVRGMPQKGEGLFKYGHAQVTDNDIFHGGLATHCILKKGTAILKIPNTVPLQIAATINCAIATVSGAIRLAEHLQGKVVLITGMGLLGITAVAMCIEAGAARVIAADISADRLLFAEKFGAHHTLNFDTSSQEEINSLLKQVDVTIDMSGAPQAIEYGINTLRVGGAAIWVGSVFNTRKIAVDAEMIVRNLLTIKGLHNYNHQDFQYAVTFINSYYNKYPFTEVVSKEFPLLQAAEAFDYAINHKPLRVGIYITP